MRQVHKVSPRNRENAREGVWESHLLDYTLFVRKHKKLPIDSPTDRGERLLAIWMGNQKTFLRKNRLSRERIALLDLFVPKWSVRERLRPEWEEMFAILKAFVSENGRFPSPTQNSAEENFLGTWLARHREVRSAQRDTKHAERTALLDSEFPEWRDLRDAEWRKNFALLQEHVALYGILPFNSKLLPDEAPISRWVIQQKKQESIGRLSAERQERLDVVAPGWRNKTNKRETERLVHQTIAERTAAQETSVTVSIISASAPNSPAL